MRNLVPKSWEAHHIDAAGTVVVAAGALLLFFAGVRPMLARQEAYRASRRRVDAHCTEAESLAKSRKGLAAELAAARKASAEHPVKLRSALELNRRIADLSHLAIGNGLKIQELEPGTAEKTAQHELVPIRLLGSGTYRTWAAFLHHLEHAFPDTAVRSFEVYGDPAKPGTAARFRVDLMWYAAARGGPGERSPSPRKGTWSLEK